MHAVSAVAEIHDHGREDFGVGWSGNVDADSLAVVEVGRDGGDEGTG